MAAPLLLVIDDEEIIIKTFSLLLQKNGYRIATAKNGQTAIALSEKEKFDLIISDIRMPGMGGVEIMKTIRSEQSSNVNKNTPFIFMTGFADITIEAEAKELSPVAYFYKPFDPVEILKTIKDTIKEDVL